jgi:hypothetical protein
MHSEQSAHANRLKQNAILNISRFTQAKAKETDRVRCDELAHKKHSEFTLYDVVRKIGSHLRKFCR